MAEIIVSETQNGGSVSAAAEDTIVIFLAENPTTGYRWQFDLPSGLTLVSDVSAPDSLAPGAGGKRKLCLTTSTPGEFFIQATMRRAWEVAAAPQSHFQVTVHVR